MGAETLVNPILSKAMKKQEMEMNTLPGNPELEVTASSRALQEMRKEGLEAKGD